MMINAKDLLKLMDKGEWQLGKLTFTRLKEHVRITSNLFTVLQKRREGDNRLVITAHNCGNP